MNDRYLFKAKRIDNEEWVQGFLTKMWGQLHIINPDDENTAYPIDETTLCQCTGLKDRNGELIWENDIVEIDFEYFQIHWDEDIARYMLVQNDKTICDFIDDNSSDVMKIVGSIIDNPELLEVENENRRTE